MLTGGLATALAAASLALGFEGVGDRLPSVLPASGYEAHEQDDKRKLPQDKADQLRRDALARARLWLEPAPSLERLDLRHNPPDLFAGAEEVACKFYPRKVEGTTPKFLCVFEGGEVLKVKYGRNPEIYTETAATRLLRALGAGADSVSLVKRLRCFGCPEDPQVLLKCISSTFADWVRSCEPIFGARAATGRLEITVDFGKYVDFAPASVQRRWGRAIETAGVAGWGFDELDEAQGGPSGRGRAQRDALRLLAVLLDNWDTHDDNQRLVCLDEPPAADGECRRPFGYMHDVGATFGRGSGSGAERKLDLAGWKAVPVWADEDACLVRLDAPRFRGPTFGQAVISERGRQYLARRLRRLTTRQIRDIFEGARFAHYPGADGPARDVEEWVRAFQDKVRQITTRKPCPTP